MTHLTRTARSETVQVNITYAIVHYTIIRYGWQLYDTACNVHGTGLLLARAKETEFKRGTGLTTKHLCHLCGHHALDILAVYCQDNITCFQARILTGSICVWLVYHHTVVLLVITYDAANTGIFARSHLTQVIIIGRIVSGKGVHLHQHSVNGPPDDGIGSQSVHIKEIQCLIYLIEYLQVPCHFGIVVLNHLSSSRDVYARHESKRGNKEKLTYCLHTP